MLRQRASATGAQASSLAMSATAREFEVQARTLALRSRYASASAPLQSPLVAVVAR